MVDLEDTETSPPPLHPKVTKEEPKIDEGIVVIKGVKRVYLSGGYLIISSISLNFKHIIITYLYQIY